MFTKVSEQRSAARRYALCKAAAGPKYDTGGWAPPVVARIPKTETPSYKPERPPTQSGIQLSEDAESAVYSPQYDPIKFKRDWPMFEPAQMRAKADPRYGNWLSAHNNALESLPINDRLAPFLDLNGLPETRKALADAYHRKMYALTNGVPTSVIPMR